MCTVTLHRDVHETLLTFNRDERRDRDPEIPPMLTRFEDTGITLLAPRDGGSLGTWIGVNSRGVAACLLNGYREPDGPPPSRETSGMNLSRGGIIPRVLNSTNLESALEILHGGLNLNYYLSFTLFLTDLRQGAAVRWDGAGTLTEIPMTGEWQMLSSSSWNAPAVLDYRRSQFDEWVQAGAPFLGEVPALHLHQPEGMAEWSPLMARRASATRSITQVRIHALGSAEMRYFPDPNRESRYAPATTKLAMDM